MAEKHLRWTERAIQEYEQLLTYLWKEWGEETTIKVCEEIDKKIFHIQKSPEQFPVFLKTKKIHRCVVSHQTSIFFRIQKESIELLSLFDNRQDPKKRKL